MENVLADRAPLRLRRPARLLRLVGDERLVALVRDGDEGAFEALYDRHHTAILGFCRHMLGTREEAEDAVQHTFLAAYRDLVGSDKPIDLRPWLFAIARNRCLSLLRARRAHVAIELAEPATDGLAATVERREDLRELLADLACLPEDQRAALLLAELGALDHAGIAAVLDCPREKVKALVFQARTSLAASREARATPCEQIRVELATATGATLRRGPLRRHLRTCDGCRAFKTEVATQRKLLALALPVVPTVALKASVLGGSGGVSASSGGTAAAAATSTASGVGLGGGVLGTVASTGAGKVAISLAVAGAVAGGGAVTAQLERQSLTRVAPAPSHVHSQRAASAPPLAVGAPAGHHGARALVPGGGAAMPPEQVDPPAPAAPSDTSAGAPEVVVPSPSPAAPTGSDESGAGRMPGSDPAPATGEPRHHDSSAEHSRQTSPSHRTHDTHPGSANPTPPGQGRTAHGEDTPPPGHGKSSRGHEKTAHGNDTPPPGQGTTPPGQDHAPPAQSRAPDSEWPPGGGSPSHGADGGGHGNGNGASAGDAGAAPSPGQSGASHGGSGASHGQSGAAHGHGD